MSYNILKQPTESQIGIALVITLIVLACIGAYYAVMDGAEKRSEYKLSLNDMKCDTLEFQALNHQWKSYRSLALAEHGGRC